MSSSPFTLRSDQDLLATFRPADQNSVVLPRQAPYPILVQDYFTWTEPSGVYTYLVFKRPDWETPRALSFQRNGSGSAHSPAGMCEWCHTTGPSDVVGLLTTHINAQTTGGSWLCLDLSCKDNISERSGMAAKNTQRALAKLMKRIGEFYERVFPSLK